MPYLKVGFDEAWRQTVGPIPAEGAPERALYDCSKTLHDYGELMLKQPPIAAPGRAAVNGWAALYGLKRRWLGLEPSWLLKRRLRATILAPKSKGLNP